VPSDLRHAATTRSTIACAAIVSALVALTLVVPADASRGSLPVVGRIGTHRDNEAWTHQHSGKHCHGRKCCRARRAGHHFGCASALPSSKATPPTTVKARSETGPPAGVTAPAASRGNVPADEILTENSEATPSIEKELEVESGDITESESTPAVDVGAPDTESPTENPPPDATPSPSLEPLTWAPPLLVNPKTIELGQGFTHTSLSPSRDYIIKMPPTKKVGATWLDGGHNIVLIGGAETIPTGTTPGVRNDAQRTAIYIKGATGTVHIEGLEIDGSGGGEFDGVDIAAPQATVQLENLRIVGVRGRYDAFHADVVQPWGGVGDLRIDRLTGTSNYQGLTLQQDLGAIGSAELTNVDLTATTEAPVDGGGHMLWLTKGVSSCTGYPITLSGVFVQPRPGLTLGTSVWPASNSQLSCDESGNTLASWSALPVTGTVQQGIPPSGSFVPYGTAGLEYRTPGYSGG
jgi:hypothetical protein